MQHNSLPEKLALTPEQVAQLVPLGEHRIRQLAKSDPSFPCFRNGKNIIIPVDGLNKWLNRQGEMKTGFPEILRRNR